MSENDANGELTVFPVPARDQVQIRFDSQRSDAVSIQLVDIAGRMVSSLPNTQVNGGENTITLPLIGIPSGVYVVEIQGAGFSARQRLIVE
jgi:hypothetical protein